MAHTAARKPPARNTAASETAEDRHERFAQEYLVDLNATAAYQRTYDDEMADTVAAVCGYKLLRNAKVADRIRDLKIERAQRIHLEQDRALRQLLDIAENDPARIFDESTGQLLDLPDMDARTRNAIASVKIRRVENQRNDLLGINETIIELKFWDKNSAVKTLMQHLGMLTEKHEISGPNGGPIPINVVERERRAAELVTRVLRRMPTGPAGRGVKF